MIVSSNELIKHSTATELAEQFRVKTTEIKEHLERALQAADELHRAFANRNSYSFDIAIYSRCRQYSVENLLKMFKITAWSTLVDRTEIRKVMSSKRQKELDEILHSQRPESADLLPEISEQTIMEVLMGYMSSAEEFLNEAIREEFDYFRPRQVAHVKLKTNQKSLYKLGEKVILHYACEFNSYGSSSSWSIGYTTKPHLMAIDNIFHLLDGKGAIKGCNGPLLDGFRNGGGISETDYFYAELFKNRNLHLKFKRKDLLDRFNSICGRNWIGQ